MRAVILLSISLLGLIVASTVSLITLAQPSEAEARSAFERLGCTACHRSGGIASSWDEIVSEYRNLAGKYASLDDFVRSEVYMEVKQKLGLEVRTWDELFTTMAQLSGKQRGDPGVKAVQNYLASTLGLQASTQTPETPATQETPATPEAPRPTPPEAIRGEERLTWGVILAFASIVAIVIGALVAALIVVRR